MAELHEIGAEKKFIAPSDDVAINPGLLLHAIYTALHKVKSSSEIPVPLPSYCKISTGKVRLLRHCMKFFWEYGSTNNS